MAVEPLPILAQSKSRPFVVDGLMSTLMNDKAIHSTCHLQIGGVLQIARMVAIGTIGVAIHGHRLGSYKAFSIEVGHRCRLADVALRH